MRNERRPKSSGKTTSSSGSGRRSTRTSTTKSDSRSRSTSRTDKPFKKSASSFKKKDGDKKEFKSPDRDLKPGGKKTYAGKSDFKKKFDSEKSPRTYKRSSDSFGDEGREKKSFKSFDKSSGSDRKKTFRSKPDSDKKYGSDKKTFGSKPGGSKKFGSKIDPKKKFASQDDIFEGKRSKDAESFSEYRDKKKNNFEERKEYKRKTGIKTYTDKKGDTYSKDTEITRNKDASKGFKKVKVYAKKEEDDGSTRLNKFIANAGFCSRREADTYIETGVVTVNGVVITELGYKVKPGDKVLFGDKPVIGEKPVYILLNKPKDYITTSKDPQNRKTVYELINGVKERVFPVGRLDRNTTGVLLLTNDGLMAEKLMHPRKGIRKIYHVEVDKRFAAPDMEHIRKGVELEDGFFTPDEVDYVDGMDKHHIGIEIHSGANRIVRRLFEALDYNVVKLDRVVYAGLDKKGLSRGKWRFLKDSEIHALKMM